MKLIADYATLKQKIMIMFQVRIEVKLISFLKLNSMFFEEGHVSFVAKHILRAQYFFRVHRK